MGEDRYGKRIRELAGQAAASLGFTLWGLEDAFAGSRRLIRLYIDRENGVTIDDCAEVSRQMGLLLDVEEAVPGAYVLEVSSPGLDRRIFSAEQFAPYVGRTVDVVLAEPHEGRRHFRGILTGVSGQEIRIDESGAVSRVDFGLVKKARLLSAQTAQGTISHDEDGRAEPKPAKKGTPRPKRR